MLKTKNYQFWFCTGSQDLYGDECLAHVAEHSKIIVDALNKSGNLPYEVVWKPTMITNEVIRKTFNEANTDENCAGVITWMHTFSPAKSWILGLQEYRKPLLHLHTQFNRDNFNYFRNATLFHRSSFLNCLIVVSLSMYTASIPMLAAQSPICSAVKS